MIKFQDLVDLPDPQKKTLKVESLPVWDYKYDDGAIKLIWEPIAGSENYEPVILDELLDAMINGEVRDRNVKVLPETGGEEFRCIESGLNDSFYNLRLK